MKTKTMPASYAPDDEAGFEAIVSVFNNKDLGGDVVRPGAFTESINTWKSSGNVIPVLWSHGFDNPHHNIGAVTDAEEIKGGDPRIPPWANPWVQEHGGLWVKAELDDFGDAAQVRHLLKKRRVTQFSFSYDVLEEKVNARGENELLKVWIHEVGPTPLGMNPLTTLVGAKSTEPEPPPEPEPDTKRRPSSALFSCSAAAQIAVLRAIHAD